jgi:hypothetical protein
LNARNRIVDILDVPGSLIRSNPQNWRTHPQEQKEALAGSLREVGVVDVLKVVPHPTEAGAYLLVDGHARAELLGQDSMVKVAVLDLTPDEQRLVLATFDPLTAMSGTDRLLLDKLLAGLVVEDSALQGLLDGMWSFELDESLRSGEDTPAPEPRVKRKKRAVKNEVDPGGVFGEAPPTAGAGHRCPTCGREYDDEY